MQQYLARRLLLFIPTLIGVSLLIFAIMRVIPGDVATAIGGEVSQEQIEMVRKELGLDRPLHLQYLEWVWGILRLDFGRSLVNRQPVIERLQQAFPLSLNLAVLTALVTLIVAVPIGVLCAIRQDTWLDYVLRVFSLTGLSIPTFWWGLMIMLFLVLVFGWLPSLAWVNFFQDPVTSMSQMIWPALALGYNRVAFIARMTRSCMLEVLREDYIRTARAKGLWEVVVVGRHALKNAIIPVVAVAGVEFGRMVGGMVVVEAVFNLPGMGKLLVEGVYSHDYPIVQGMFLLTAASVCLANLGVDLLYGWFDPRIRYR